MVCFIYIYIYTAFFIHVYKNEKNRKILASFQYILI